MKNGVPKDFHFSWNKEEIIRRPRVLRFAGGGPHFEKNDQTDDEDKQNRGSSAVHIGLGLNVCPARNGSSKNLRGHFTCGE